MPAGLVAIDVSHKCLHIWGRDACIAVHKLLVVGECKDRLRRGFRGFRGRCCLFGGFGPSLADDAPVAVCVKQAQRDQDEHRCGDELGHPQDGANVF